MKKGFIIQIDKEYIIFDGEVDYDQIGWANKIEEATIFEKESDIEDFINKPPEELGDFSLSDYVIHEVEVGTVILNTFSIKVVLFKKEKK